MTFDKYVVRLIAVIFIFLIFSLAGCKSNTDLLSLDDESLVPVHRSFEKELIVQGIDDKMDGHVLYKNVRSIENYHVSGGAWKSAVTSLAGIEYFTSLKTLRVNATAVDSLDVSKNKELIDILCEGNDNATGGKLLRYLNVSGCEKLRYLYCENNALTSLNLSSNKELLSLQCSSNNLGEIELRANTKLRYIACSDNPLKKLLLNSQKLEYLVCEKTEIKDLDLSKQQEMKFLSCYGSPVENLVLKDNDRMDSMNIDRTGLVSVDYTQIPNLVGLRLGSTWGVKWTDSRMMDIGALTNLKKLRCGNLNIDRVDFSRNKELENLDIDFSQIGYLSLVGNARLKDLTVFAVGRLVNLDLRSCINLVSCEISGCIDLQGVCVSELPVSSDEKWTLEKPGILRVCR